MDKNRVLRVFNQYMKNYNLNKNDIKTRYFHSLRVMELCEDIASMIGVFSEEDVLVCGVIGLFHDIASFDNDNYSSLEEDIDLSRKSVSILFENDSLIRKITDDTRYDNFIKIAIYCYNKDSVPDKLDSKVIYYCNVLKDAHIIDSLRLVNEYSYADLRIDCYPTELVYNKFKEFKCVNIKASDNKADNILVSLSQVFSISFRYSYQVLLNDGYVSRIVSSLEIKDKGLDKFFKQIGNGLNNFIKRKIGG